MARARFKYSPLEDRLVIRKGTAVTSRQTERNCGLSGCASFDSRNESSESSWPSAASACNSDHERILCPLFAGTGNCKATKSIRILSWLLRWFGDSQRVAIVELLRLSGAVAGLTLVSPREIARSSNRFRPSVSTGESVPSHIFVCASAKNRASAGNWNP